jgi:hypothetical protein
MKKVLSIVALMAFMVSSASVVNFKEKEKKKAKTEKSSCSDKKEADKKSCASTEKKSCCSKK